MAFDRLIRFVDINGQLQYGNLEATKSAREIEGSSVQLVLGNLDSGFEVQSERATVKKLLSPIESTPLILCAGVNYRSHSRETKFTLPKKPVIFATPADRLTGPIDDIPIHPDAQELLDYEGELTVVIGKDGYDIPETEALDYVLGYTVGNDISARNLHAVENSGYQMGYAKSFDAFGPIGPALVSPRLIPDPLTLHLTTKVNGQKRQDASTAEMIWSIRQLISFASRGRTLRKGTVIMTGTPEGVGWHSNGCLKDGDVVEVEITELGSISNRMAFKK